MSKKWIIVLATAGVLIIGTVVVVLRYQATRGLQTTPGNVVPAAGPSAVSSNASGTQRIPTPQELGYTDVTSPVDPTTLEYMRTHPPSGAAPVQPRPSSNPVTAPAPVPVAAPLDSDHDGLTDAQEAQIGTNPNNPDSDGDGLSDGQEVLTYHTNPLNPDTDGDGLSDGDEVHKYKTDPLNPDTDGDGYKDGDEVKNGYNPLGPGKCPTPGCVAP